MKTQQESPSESANAAGSAEGNETESKNLQRTARKQKVETDPPDEGREKGADRVNGGGTEPSAPSEQTDTKAPARDDHREVTRLSRALVQAHRDHAQALEQALSDREEILRSNEDLTQQLAELRTNHRNEADEFKTQHDELKTERDRLAAELTQWRAHYKREVEALTHERDAAGRERDDLRQKLDAELEKHRSDVQALSSQRDGLAAEQIELSTALGQLRDSRQKELQALITQRDTLTAERDQLAAAVAKLRVDHKAEITGIITENEKASEDCSRLTSELATFRDAHEVEVVALTAEREKLMAAAADLRANLVAVQESRRHEVDAIKHEQNALINECTEARSMLESDRVAWGKQIGFFSEERATLVREREEAMAELARERQAAAKQDALRNEECGTLIKQRDAMLAQIEELQTAQKRQGDLFEQERTVLLRERDDLIGKVEESFQALGEGRSTLVQKRNEAESALGATKELHRREIETLANERDAAMRERDAASRELEVFRAARVREQASFGGPEARKIEPKTEMVHEGLHMVCEARDTALARDVEMRTIRGAGSSEERQKEVIAEARAIAQLQHPNIPPVYELGFDDGGRVFYTTKTVRGMSLRAVLDELQKGRTGSLLHFSLRRLLGIFHRVCDALAYAHAKDITHGQLKPEHIILGDFGEVFVTEWGQARADDAAGNPSEAFHPRDDIMALGRILYEMATLEAPPEIDSNGHAAESSHKTLFGKRPWKDEKGVEGLADTARRAMNRKASEKFFSVRELQLHVDSFRDNFEHEARLTVRRILRLWAQRHKVAIIVTIVLLAVIAVAAGVFAVQRGMIGAQPANQPQPRVRVEMKQPEGPRLPAPKH